MGLGDFSVLSAIYLVELNSARQALGSADHRGEGGRYAEKLGVQLMAHAYARAAGTVIFLDVKSARHPNAVRRDRGGNIGIS